MEKMELMEITEKTEKKGNPALRENQEETVKKGIGRNVLGIISMTLKIMG